MHHPTLLAGLCAALCGQAAFAVNDACKVASAPTITPVIELYTSEGCSSCPPADRWVSSLKPVAASGRAVVQAFHVGYWDYIGWVDRFASPAHTQRQRMVSEWNGLPNIYTPQVVRNGQDWRDLARATASGDAARAQIVLERTAADAFSATVTPLPGVKQWSAYWTVTEHGHSSKVKAGENAGEFLQHDFVVRQYVPLGDYREAATVTLRALPAQVAHPRQVNLVVFDPRTGRTLQALSTGC